MNIFQRALAYKDGMKTLLSWTANSGELVDAATAQARADVCARCPLNVKDWAITESVAEAIKKHLELKHHLGLTLANESGLHTCSACGCVNKLKVWLPIQFVYPQPELKAKLDPECWILK